MIFMNYFLIILWACVSQILAPTSPPTGQEIDGQAYFANENKQRDFQRLHIYVDIIKNIDIEQSMESFVELMNMLRLMFPIRFAVIKKKMFDMYDPITRRSFGVAFQALMNILRDRSKRDKLHSIFQDLMIPHSSDASKSPHNMHSITLQQSEVRFDLPLKYKRLPAQQTNHLATAVEKPRPMDQDNFQNRLPTENTPDESIKSGGLNPAEQHESDQPPRYSSPKKIRRRRASGNLTQGQSAKSQFTERKVQNSETEESNPVEKFNESAFSTFDQEKEVVNPSTSFENHQKSSGMKTGLEEVSNEPQTQEPQTNILQQETANSADEISDIKRQETEQRLARMKSFLDRVKNTSSAPASLQAKAAKISQILANERMAASSDRNGELKVPRIASRRMEQHLKK